MSTIAGLHKRTLLGTAGLGTVGVVGGSGALLAAGAATLGALAFAALELHSPERSTTRRWLVHGITVVVLLLALLSARSLQVDSVFVILMLGVANRALLRTSSRDDLLIVGGATVLLTAATVVTSGLGFALLLMVSIPCAAAALWTSTMLAGAEHAPSEHARLRSRRTPAGLARIALGSLVLTLAGFGVSTVLPRYRFTPFLGAGALARFPGSSDSMQMSNDGAPDREDGAVVLHVVPQDGVEGGALQGLYARQFALDELEGQVWRSRTGGHFPARQGMDAALVGRPKVRIAKARESRGGTHVALPVLGRTRPWAVSGQGVHYDASGTVVVDGMKGRTFDYVAGVDVPLSPPLLGASAEARTSSVVRALPSDLDPRVVALGRQLVAGAVDDDDKVRRVLAHFSRGFSYTTEPLTGDAPDPLVRFLFESKRGHCELYAGAVAVLLRVADIDARVASGYYGGHWNDVGEFLTFSQGDAHAWVEVRTAGSDWRWVDATPEDLRGSPQSGSALLRRVRDWYDAASALWFNEVVDYDARRQQAFYMGLARALDDQLRAWRQGDAVSGTGALARLVAGEGRETSPLLALPALLLIAVGGGLWGRHQRTTAALGRRLRGALGARAEDRGVPLGVLASRAGRPEAAAAVHLYERLRFGADDQRPPRAEVMAAIRALERRGPARAAEDRAA